jgi:hypothetical protein
MTLEILGAIVRWLIGLGAGALVARHVLTADQGDRLTSDIVRHILLAVPIMAPIVWSIATKVRDRIKARAESAAWLG